MKKKTMRAWFIILFIIGIIVGWLLPGNFKDLTRKPVQAGIFDVPKKLGQLDNENAYSKYTVLAETETGRVTLLRVDGAVPNQMHLTENQFIYLFKGKAKITIGTETNDAMQGQLIAVPAGTPHSFERIGDSPVEIIMFSTPVSEKEDAVLLDKE